MDWYIGAWKKYAQFSGRARRTEYWYFQLFSSIAAIILIIPVFFLIALSNRNSPAWNFVLLLTLPFTIFSFASILPSLAIVVRRLHDIGRSGWWYFIGFVPFVGPIVLLIFTLLDSEPGMNLYGPNPKGRADAGADAAVYVLILRSALEKQIPGMTARKTKAKGGKAGAYPYDRILACA